MTDPRPSAQQVATVRALYAEGRAIKDITAETGFSAPRIYAWLDREIAPDGTVRAAPLPRRRLGASGARDPDLRRRRSLANRIWRAAEAQVCEIETRLAALGGAPAEAERDARALAVLARVVRELAALGAAARKAAADDAAPREDTAARDDGPPRDDEDARGPADLDSFRRELARRLDALRGDRPD
ncbi:hypothetical protein [Aquabacter spiritensis]|uniref:Homeodomain-like domain-containing protein n=1 Tax=Aquabacter spiritensis TaxID=933073 RepID=A0A4V2UYJ2_9HYPH|nr:hypothetical protein [Aquabacter spiritensis]TCT07638.1 hypothetical protein EDC64_101157 [Aquabacter spiritensis]